VDTGFSTWRGNISAGKTYNEDLAKLIDAFRESLAATTAE